ncbi:diacylglycerol kinase family protein [Gemmatimonas sp.]|uniref:diacylglycerol/lipid kinase family protein n=1 Tax=Gemmatimonas sp. TaxID=1962908 RepID=UPI0035627F9B
MKTAIIVLINSGAGSIKDERDRAKLLGLLAATVPDAEVRCTDAHVTMHELIRQAMRDVPSMLVAGGGDGTINAVASAVVGTSVILGVLPLGTLNHFATDLRIPTTMAAAVELLRDGVVRDVDVGGVNERIFLDNAGLGLYLEIVERRESKQRAGLAKWPAAIAATVQALIRYRQFGVRLHANDTVLLRRTAALLVGTNEYTNPDSLEPHRPSLTSGMLAVYIPRAQPLAIDLGCHGRRGRERWLRTAHQQRVHGRIETFAHACLYRR